MESYTITILLVGDEKCGKSTFLSRISKGRHNLKGKVPITLLRDLDQPFIFDIRTRRGEYRFEFYDTSSPESWRLLRPDLIILCYDISQRLSLINLQRVWNKEIRTAGVTGDTTPILMLGLKRDLRSENDPNGIIYPQEAYRIAQEMRSDKYMECSAVTGELLEEVFDDICTTALRTTTSEGGQSEAGCAIM
ncbi:P-loop containing nucleoside triphosphate hydrolase protein [Sordaria brevicollis]|uniref:P-loop containing nucleoside triphosphate hydrolase protein n=1 Tax=Sordaria brevicollis TaxID=83679 RepID=A0AAE0PCH7_SORBR|nr:P-loop containing nucleoside triphosphate hydrolase protein [Sordaria brevicollis]